MTSASPLKLFRLFLWFQPSKLLAICLVFFHGKKRPHFIQRQTITILDGRGVIFSFFAKNNTPHIFRCWKCLTMEVVGPPSIYIYIYCNISLNLKVAFNWLGWALCSLMFKWLFFLPFHILQIQKDKYQTEINKTSWIGFINS